MRTEAVLAPMHPGIKPLIEGKASLIPNPNFLSPDWTHLKIDGGLRTAPENNSFSVRFLEITPTKQKIAAVTESVKIISESVTPKIEEVKKSLAYNPGRNQRSYIDEVGRRIVRQRRASRCLTDKPHHPDRCKGRAHLRNDTPQDESTEGNRGKPVSKDATDKKSENKSRTSARQARSRVMIGGRRPRSRKF